MTNNILLAGVGGQGTVLASKIIAQCAINRGEMVRTAETIGMAQRGGSVVSHVRMGGGINSPLIPLKSARLVIGFEPAEAVRVLPYLSPDGAVVVNIAAVKPVTDALSKTDYDGNAMLRYIEQRVKRTVRFDGTATAATCGMQKTLNIALLGAAAGSGFLGYGVEEVERAIEQLIPQKHREGNLRTLQAAAKQFKQGEWL